MATKKKAKKAAKKKAAPAAGDYEGKQHYPRALYGKDAAGNPVTRSVAHEDEHAAVEQAEPGAWSTEPPSAETK